MLSNEATIQRPLHEFGGSGPPLHLAVANGFPPATYAPFVVLLGTRYRVFSLPPRALWPGIGGPPPRPGSWTTLADDLLAGWDAQGIDSVVAVGHSFGGVASLLAAVREPTRFRALILLDPTIFAPPVMAEIAALRRRGERIRGAMIDGTRRRRARFVSVDQAYEYWRGREQFRLWPDAIVRLYAESMTRPATDGDGLELSWSSAWEAHYYESFYTETWRDAARLSPTIPLLVLVGETSSTVRPETVVEMRRIWPWATVRTIPGHGHLFPQEMGAVAGEMVAEWLAGQG